MSDKYLEKLAPLVQLKQSVGELNPALEKCYPVAIVRDDHFLIYDIDDQQKFYSFKKNARTPMPISAGIRAAFQLQDYGGRIACVVTPEVFDSIDGYITILHEFVHCFQYETCEQDLKMKLDIARQAQEKGDYMWEIEHPFPYAAENFKRPYEVFLNALETESRKDIVKIRKMLKNYLGIHDYEYMVWQEWKEGFARWVENKVKRQLRLEENKRGLQQPYDRVLFYAGGDAYIRYMVKESSEVAENLMILFQKLYTT